MAIHAEAYCGRGFAFVWQHCRGTGQSEGVWVPNDHDRQDGQATLTWLNQQDWIESIGYWGSSYLAFTGWIIADILPDKVKTLYLTHYGTDRFTSAYQNGLFRQDVLTSWTMGNAGQPIEADYQESLRFQPHIDVDEKLWGIHLDWYRDWISNTSRQDPYWNSGFWHALQEIPARITIPVYLGEGWYDHHLGSALRTWEKLSPLAKAHSVLRIGAWNHFFMPCIEGQVGENIANSDIPSAFAWFEKILCQQERPHGCVRTYQIGADRWQEQPAYPFTPQVSRTFYMAVMPEGPGGLTEESPDRSGRVQYTYDPGNPVPSHGAESLLATMRENGSLSQPPCSWRPDVISFVSPSLAEPLAILGKIQVVLHVSSSADDTAFTAKLIEVRPDGSAYNIRSGITTLGYREGSDSERLTYEPGSVVEAIIDFWDINWFLSAGAKLRLDVSSSDFPQYAIHSNFSGVWALQDKTRLAEQMIYTGPDYASRLILPVQNS